MNKYRVRCYDVGIFGFFSQADGYEDFDFTSPKDLATFAKELCRDGFQAGNKWICPGAIVWVKQR
jgi:hypothetical protein